MTDQDREGRGNGTGVFDTPTLSRVPPGPHNHEQIADYACPNARAIVTRHKRTIEHLSVGMSEERRDWYLAESRKALAELDAVAAHIDSSVPLYDHMGDCPECGYTSDTVAEYEAHQATHIDRYGSEDDGPG